MCARWATDSSRCPVKNIRRWSLAHRAAVLFIFLAGSAVSLFLWRTLDWWEAQAFQSELDTRANACARLLDVSILRSMDVLHSIGSLMSSHGAQQPIGVTREQFRLFVAGALRQQPELQALGWTPRVPANQRATFEAAARADGLAGFEFQELGGHGEPIRARDRAEYLPVYYLEPEARNALALGFELDSDATRAAAMRLSAATAAPAATPPVRLVQDRPGGDLGFVVYLAVPPPTGAPGAAPIGYASAVYRIHDLADRVAMASAAPADEGLTFELSDLSTGLLYHRQTADAPVSDWAGRASLPLAARRWAVTLRPAPQFVAAHRHRESWLVLTGGLLMTVLVTAYLSAVVRRRVIIEQRVAERTLQLQTEVAERQRAEAAARAAEAKYRVIFQNAVEGIFQTTPDGRYLDANPALARVYGYDSIAQLAADLTNIANQLYVDPGRREEFVRRVQADGVLEDFESQVYRKDGSVIWIAENARVVRDDQGAVLYFEGTVVDITERRRTADLLRSDRDALESRVLDRTAELDRAVQRLQVEVAERRRAEEVAAAANTAKTRFLANVSHEIRTPMNAILGYAQLLGAAANLTAQQRESMATVLASGRHLLDLIDDVLDLSKVEAGRAELRPAPFSPAAVIRDLATLFAGRCQQKGLALDVHMPPHLPPRVIGDERKLRQVLINLLGNAVKFTDSGRITLRLERAAKAGGYLFEVGDTGQGVDPEAMEIIFEPFQQDAAGERHGGTGLGLAIARGLIELMGARLLVDSSPGRGSRFYFEIALPTEEMQEETTAGADGGRTIARHVILRSVRPPRVLVVDDVAESRRVVADLARAIGCVVTTAASADEALAAVRQACPDLVLMDIVMPGTDGMAAAPLLAAVTAGRSKLVAMSASAMLHERERYAAAGFSAFLAKPIELDALARVSARLLGLPLEDEPREQSPAIAERTTAEDVVPSELLERVLLAAQCCNVSDLKRCLAEVEAEWPNSAAAGLVRRGLRAYDMDLIVAGLPAGDRAIAVGEPQAAQWREEPHAHD